MNNTGIVIWLIWLLNLLTILPTCIHSIDIRNPSSNMFYNVASRLIDKKLKIFTYKGDLGAVLQIEEAINVTKLKDMTLKEAYEHIKDSNKGLQTVINAEDLETEFKFGETVNANKLKHLEQKTATEHTTIVNSLSNKVKSERLHYGNGHFSIDRHMSDRGYKDIRKTESGTNHTIRNRFSDAIAYTNGNQSTEYGEKNALDTSGAWDTEYDFTGNIQWGPREQLQDKYWYEQLRCMTKTWPPCYPGTDVVGPAHVTQRTFMNREVSVARKWLCSYIIFTKPERGCKCDVECILFGDCCIDAFNVTLGIEDENKLITAITEPERLYSNRYPFSFESSYLTLYHRFGSCRELNINDNEVTIYVVDKCPDGNSTAADKLYKNMCSNHSAQVLNSVPVSFAFSKRWQIVFSNIFCALCHDLDKADFVVWDAYAKCRDDLNVTGMEDVEDLILRSCTSVYIKPLNIGGLRHCVKAKNLRYDCSAASDVHDTDIQTCPAYIAPVSFNGISYKNLHCAYCDHRFVSKYNVVRPLVDIPSTKYPFTHGLFPFAKPGMAGPQGLHIPTARPPSMRILFDFSFQAGLIFNINGRSDHDKSRHCGDKSVYDFISGSCKPVICPMDGEWIDGQCKHKEIVFVSDEGLFPYSNNTKEGQILSVISAVKDSANVNGTVILQGYVFKLKEIIKNYIANDRNDINISAINIYPLLNDESVDDDKTVVLTLQIDSGNKLQLSEIIKITAKFTRLISKIKVENTINVLKTTLSNRVPDQTYECLEGRILKHVKTITTATENDTVYLINKQTNVAYQALETRYTFKFLPLSENIPKTDDVLMCSYPQCPQIKLSDQDFTFNNGTVQLVMSGEHLSPTQYEIRNGSIYICAHKRHIEKKTWEFYMPYAEVIQEVTYILSIIALVFTILIYIKSASVRSLHGKTLVSLSISLIGAQLTSLLQNDSIFILCKAVAIVMHFSWLAAFGWMSMISFDLVRTFFGRQTTITNTHATRQRYFIYSIFGWIVPAVIVITCVVLDSTDGFDLVQIGYGKGIGCFISGMRAVFIFLTIPHLFSVVFNVVAFVLTVYGISKKHKAGPASKRSKDRLFFLIYLKLFVVMGVSWLFAILASITNFIVFWYLHFVLNGLQGVFVFASFALRASIWKHIRIGKISRATLYSKSTTFYSISGKSTLNS